MGVYDLEVGVIKDGRNSFWKLTVDGASVRGSLASLAAVSDYLYSGGTGTTGTLPADVIGAEASDKAAADEAYLTGDDVISDVIGEDDVTGYLEIDDEYVAIKLAEMLDAAHEIGGLLSASLDTDTITQEC